MILTTICPSGFLYVRAEKYLLDCEFIINAMRATNPAVLLFHTKRIALLSIAKYGLHGIAATQVQYLDNDCTMARQLKVYSTIEGNTLYIPTSWSYPRFDAVLVSRHYRKKSGKIAATAVPDTHSNDESASHSAIASPNTETDLDSESPAVAEPQLERVRIQFIHISVGEVADETRAKTRAILEEGSPERLLWRHTAVDYRAANGADVDVAFGIRWLVSRAEATRIQNTRGFERATEKVSLLSEVNHMLDL